MDDLHLLLESSKKDSTFTSDWKENMTLYALLDVLDGYSYLNNCVVIITTNYPEKLDPAIIRPGRIDYDIIFDFCDEYQFDNIFKYFTNKDYKKINPKFIFKENMYTTSFLINIIIIPHTNNPTKILELLNN